MQENVIRLPDEKKRFCDFAKETFALDGEKISVDRLLNKDIEVVGFKISESKYKKGDQTKCLSLQIKMDGKLFICFTGSAVLIAQIEKYCNEIPFTTVIKKQFKYFTMT